MSDSRAPVPDALSSGTPAREDAPADWEWLLGAVWLVFLGFPLAALLADESALGLRVLGIAALVVFALLYVDGLRRVDWVDTERELIRGGWRLVPMLLIGLLLAPIIGPEATGVLPFVVTLAIMALPLRVGLLIAGACLVVAVVVPLATGELGGLVIAAVVVLVGAFLVLIRSVEERGKQRQLLEDERALSNERDRVARDVHDVLGHSLTVVTVKVELAERLIDIDPERAKAELAQVRSMTRESLAEIRATVAGLRVARLTEELSQVAHALDGAGIEAQLPTDPEVVDPRHRITLAWALREAVTNVVRHAGASRCTVTWGADWLVVDDDGVGIGARRDGNGLRGMRERVRAAGGSVEVGPAPQGPGTRLRVQL